MSQTSHAKYALAALVVCANAHCVHAKLSIDRLAQLLVGTGKPNRHEKLAIGEILSNADGGLLDRAREEAWEIIDGVGLGKRTQTEECGTNV